MAQQVGSGLVSLGPVPCGSCELPRTGIITKTCHVRVVSKKGFAVPRQCLMKNVTHKASTIAVAGIPAVILPAATPFLPDDQRGKVFDEAAKVSLSRGREAGRIGCCNGTGKKKPRKCGASHQQDINLTAPEQGLVLLVFQQSRQPGELSILAGYHRQ